MAPTRKLANAASRPQIHLFKSVHSERLIRKTYDKGRLVEQIYRTHTKMFLSKPKGCGAWRKHREADGRVLYPLRDPEDPKNKDVMDIEVLHETVLREASPLPVDQKALKYRSFYRVGKNLTDSKTLLRIDAPMKLEDVPDHATVHNTRHNTKESLDPETPIPSIEDEPIYRPLGPGRRVHFPTPPRHERPNPHVSEFHGPVPGEEPRHIHINLRLGPPPPRLILRMGPPPASR